MAKSTYAYQCGPQVLNGEHPTKGWFSVSPGMNILNYSVSENMVSMICERSGSGGKQAISYDILSGNYTCGPVF